LQQFNAEIPGTEFIYETSLKIGKTSCHKMTQREKDNETEIAQVLALPPPPQQRQTFSDESPTESKKLIQLSKYNLKKATKYGCKKYNAKRFSKCSTSKRVRKNAA
jgi:hypothetical protein